MIKLYSKYNIRQCISQNIEMNYKNHILFFTDNKCDNRVPTQIFLKDTYCFLICVLFPAISADIILDIPNKIKSLPWVPF